MQTVKIFFTLQRAYTINPISCLSPPTKNDEKSLFAFYLSKIKKNPCCDKLDNKLLKTQDLAKQLKEILDYSWDGILVTDGDGNVLYVNNSYERIAAIKINEVQDKNMRELINPIWMKNSVAFVVQKHKIPVSKSQITKDGRNIIVTGNPIFDEHHNIKKIIINVRDITEIYKLREELIESRKREFRYFENILDNDHSKEFSSSTVVVSPAIQEAFSMASKVGKFDATVLITGESGSGKEEVAKHIHANSMRKDKPFITINCGAIPDNLLESELFGYVKGAFTGANHSGKKGLLEVADTGTVFLDEVGELPLSFQVKLLRTIENKEIIRVGDVKATPIDVRFIAATNCDLQTMLERGEFREDLYYRLNVVHIVVPPLKQRKEDILPLCIYFLKIFNAKYSQHKRLSDEVIKMMETYLWPGNVRELRNLIERMVVMSSNEYLQVSDLPWSEEKIKLLLKKRAIPSLVKAEGYNFEEEISRYEKELLLQAKQKYATTREIGKYLHIDQSTVVRKMKKYGI